MENRADTLIFHTAICVGAPQIVWMADESRVRGFRVALSRKALRNGEKHA